MYLDLTLPYLMHQKYVTDAYDALSSVHTD